MERQRAVEFLLDEPYKLGHMLGFTKLTELHNDWIRAMILGKEDETLQAHRGSYKTTCVSVALSLDIVLLPNVRTMFMRKTDNDIKEVVSQVKKILQSPHMRYFVQSIYGVDLKLTTSTAGEISTNLTTDIRGTAQLVGLGMGGSLTGKHFDRIFTDDIVNVQDRISKAERDRTKLIYQELQNIKNRGGRIFNTGTPWHKDDAFSLMPNAKKYDCYSTNLMTAEQIAEVKQQMTASLFAANYELRHIASEDVIFDNPNINAEPHYIEQGECHIDAAYGGEDWTAFTICRKHDGKYYVLGKCWRKHIDDVQDEIIKLRQLYNAGKIHCETNGDKGYLAKALKAKGERVSAYHENMNKFLKITSYLKSEWKNVYFVAGTDKDYIDQICDYNENAEHDDCPDSLSSLIRMLWKKSNIDKDKLLFLR
jgi:predicted phage terminase large subunit-like protein